MGSCQHRDGTGPGLDRGLDRIVRLGGDPDLVTAEGDGIPLAIGIVAGEGGTSSWCFQWGFVMPCSIGNEGEALFLFCILQERVSRNNSGKCRILLPLYFLCTEDGILIR
jgi:hypothetical protein